MAGTPSLGILLPSVEGAVAVGAMHLPAGAAAAVCIIMITAGPAPALQAKVTVEASMAGACTMASHSQDPGVVVQALAARAQAAVLAVVLAVDFTTTNATAEDDVTGPGTATGSRCAPHSNSSKCAPIA